MTQWPQHVKQTYTRVEWIPLQRINDSCTINVTWRRTTRRSRAKSTLRRQHRPSDFTAWLRTAGSVFWMPGKIYRTKCNKDTSLFSFSSKSHVSILYKIHTKHNPTMSLPHCKTVYASVAVALLHQAILTDLNRRDSEVTTKFLASH